jgi:hypothetical protein
MSTSFRPFHEDSGISSKVCVCFRRRLRLSIPEHRTASLDYPDSLPDVEARSNRSIDLRDPTASTIDTVAEMLNHGGQLTVGIAAGNAGSREEVLDIAHGNAGDEDDDAASYYTVPSVSELVSLADLDSSARNARWRATGS